MLNYDYYITVNKCIYLVMQGQIQERRGNTHHFE